jgi:hypothetical protein
MRTDSRRGLLGWAIGAANSRRSRDAEAEAVEANCKRLLRNSLRGWAIINKRAIVLKANVTAVGRQKVSATAGSAIFFLWCYA